jgi:hypothetical protein
VALASVARFFAIAIAMITLAQKQTNLTKESFSQTLPAFYDRNPLVSRFCRAPAEPLINPLQARNANFRSMALETLEAGRRGTDS